MCKMCENVSHELLYRWCAGGDWREIEVDTTEEQIGRMSAESARQLVEALGEEACIDIDVNKVAREIADILHGYRQDLRDDCEED